MAIRIKRVKPKRSINKGSKDKDLIQQAVALIKKYARLGKQKKLTEADIAENKQNIASLFDKLAHLLDSKESLATSAGKLAMIRPSSTVLDDKKFEALVAEPIRNKALVASYDPRIVAELVESGEIDRKVASQFLISVPGTPYIKVTPIKEKE